MLRSIAIVLAFVSSSAFADLLIPVNPGPVPTSSFECFNYTADEIKYKGNNIISTARVQQCLTWEIAPRWSYYSTLQITPMYTTVTVQGMHVGGGPINNNQKVVTGVQVCTQLFGYRGGEYASSNGKTCP